jgi:predicted NBD/HSP70 family sugar kinase
LAVAIASAVGGHLARAIRTLVLLYGVDRVVVGGGLSRAGTPFLRPILDELEREKAASPLMGHALGASPVELLPPDADPGAWGAVVVARSRIGSGSGPTREGEVADG